MLSKTLWVLDLAELIADIHYQSGNSIDSVKRPAVLLLASLITICPTISPWLNAGLTLIHSSSSVAVSTWSLFDGPWIVHSGSGEGWAAGGAIVEELLGLLSITMLKLGVLVLCFTDLPNSTCCFCCCYACALVVVAAVTMACCLSFQVVLCWSSWCLLSLWMLLFLRSQ